VLRRRAVNRAAESIVSNIVEGCAASSRKEFVRFLDISIKSTSEVDYQLQLARDLGVLRHAQWKPLAQEVVELRKMLSALRRTVLDAAQFRTRPRGRSSTLESRSRKRVRNQMACQRNQRVRTSVLMTLTE
jgi:four helix bundle protein